MNSAMDTPALTITTPAGSYPILVGAGLLASLPEQLAALRADPLLSKVATEEILRASSVTMHFRRTVTEDSDIGGVPVAGGDKVVIWYTSANYDDTVFEDPFRFDITREPNNHVTFGTGRHVCLGAALARLEVRVFLEEFLRRVATYEVGEPDLLRSNFIRGIKHLPMRVEV